MQLTGSEEELMLAGRALAAAVTRSLHLIFWDSVVALSCPTWYPIDAKPLGCYSDE